MTYESQLDDWGKLLVKHGFIKKNKFSEYKLTDKGTFELIQGGGFKGKHADMEYGDEENIQAKFEKNFKRSSVDLTFVYEESRDVYLRLIEK